MITHASQTPPDTSPSGEWEWVINPQHGWWELKKKEQKPWWAESEIKDAPKQECSHKGKLYVGIIQKFEYCEVCDLKKDVDQ